MVAPDKLSTFQRRVFHHYEVMCKAMRKSIIYGCNLSGGQKANSRSGRTGNQFGTKSTKINRASQRLLQLLFKPALHRGKDHLRRVGPQDQDQDAVTKNRPPSKPPDGVKQDSGGQFRAYSCCVCLSSLNLLRTNCSRSVSSNAEAMSLSRPHKKILFRSQTTILLAPHPLAWCSHNNTFPS